MSSSRIYRPLYTSIAGPSRLAAASPLPPPFLLPSLATLSPYTTKRTFLSRRRTSFWAQSYPSAREEPLVPSLPPPAKPRAPGEDARKGVDIRERKRERKERYLDSLMDKAGELSLRCSILDSEGNWTAEEGRYKKSELCREYDLDPRDLRKLDSLTPNLVPLILTRKTCILISMLHIRALIKPDRVIIFEHAGTVESEVQRRFKWHLERNVRAGRQSSLDEPGCDEELGLSYEHRALESIFVATANALEEEMTFTRELVRELLADLEDDINRDNLKRLLHNSRRMVGFQSRARYVKRAVDEVLESDEDLSAMYLTSRARGQPRALHDHEQLELLLESFTKQVEEIVSEIDTTVANMNSTQEITELMLDSGRNALLALDVKVSIATLGIGTGAMIAGIFGMNLTSHFESHPFAFPTITASVSLVAFFVFLYGLKVMRRVRRVALSGNGPSHKLGRITPPQLWDGDLPTLNQHGRIAEGWLGDRLRQREAFFRGLFGRGATDERVLGMMRQRGGMGDWKWGKGLRYKMAKLSSGGVRGKIPNEGWRMNMSGLAGVGEKESGDHRQMVWINRQADEARLRDAARYKQMKEEGYGEGREEGWNGEKEKAWARKIKFGKE